MGTLTVTLVVPPELAFEEVPLNQAAVKVPFKPVPVMVIAWPRVTGLGLIARMTGVPVREVTGLLSPPQPVSVKSTATSAITKRTNLGTAAY